MSHQDARGIQVEFFASLRESVGCHQVLIPAEESKRLADVEDVRSWVAEHLGEGSSGALFNETVRTAVNDEFVDLASSVTAGCRVAFMPAVTGG